MCFKSRKVLWFSGSDYRRLQKFRFQSATVEWNKTKIFKCRFRRWFWFRHLAANLTLFGTFLRSSTLAAARARFRSKQSKSFNRFPKFYSSALKFLISINFKTDSLDPRTAPTIGPIIGIQKWHPYKLFPLVKTVGKPATKVKKRGPKSRAGFSA